MSSILTPSAVENRAELRKRLPFGAGPRFFVALLLGLLWLAPAWWLPHLIAPMFLWDALVLTAWLLDLLRLPRASQISLSRTWPTPLALGRATQVAIRIQNFGRIPITATLVDETPVALRDEPPVVSALIAPGASENVHYTVVPRERGNTTVAGYSFVTEARSALPSVGPSRD